MKNINKGEEQKENIATIGSNKAQSDENSAEEIGERKGKSSAKNVWAKIGCVALEIIKWTFIAILVLIVVGNIVTRVKKRNGDNVPTFMGYAMLKIVSHSMTPTISYGDVVIIHSQGGYEIGDVITYNTGSPTPNTHRIIDYVLDPLTSERLYRTQGDYAYNSPDQTEGDYDSYVKNSAIYGKVVVTLKNGGGFFAFISSPIGVVLILAVGLIICFLPDIIKVIKESREKEKLKKKIQSLEVAENTEVELRNETHDDE